MRSQLAEWRFHVIDTQVRKGDKVAAVYSERDDADALVTARNLVWPERYKVIDTEASE